MKRTKKLSGIGLRFLNNNMQSTGDNIKAKARAPANAEA